jgi:hypothetical protein
MLPNSVSFTRLPWEGSLIITVLLPTSLLYCIPTFEIQMDGGYKRNKEGIFPLRIESIDIYRVFLNFIPNPLTMKHCNYN